MGGEAASGLRRRGGARGPRRRRRAGREPARPARSYAGGAAGSAALGAARRARPAARAGVGLAIAVVGWALDTQTKVESDVTKLVPQNLPALADLQALQKSTGVGGEIDVLVRRDMLTRRPPNG